MSEKSKSSPSDSFENSKGEFIKRLLLGIFITVVAVGASYLSHIGALILKKSEGDLISYIGSVITERGWIPYLELLFFWMAIITLVVMLIRRRNEKNAFKNVGQFWISERQRVGAGTDLGITNDKGEDVFENVKAKEKEFLASKSGRRLFYAVRRYHKTGTSTEVDDLLNTMSEIDNAAIDTAYSNLRLWTWLIPTLGFIGTVIGIGLGISGFGSIIDVAGSFKDVQAAIPGVTRDLGIAFDTTLLALVLTAAITGGASYMQQRDEEFLAQLDSFFVEEVAGVFEEDDASTNQIGEFFDEQTRELSKYLVAICKLLKKNESMEAKLDLLIEQMGNRNENS